MASHEEAPYEEISYAEPEWDWGSEPDADQYEDPYADTYVRWPETQPQIRRPWHRNPIILLGLIAAASVPLSVAAVLLLTGDTDDRPMKFTPTIRTTAVAIPPPESASEQRAVESTPETPAESAATATESADAQSSEAPAEAPAGAQAPQPSARSQDGGSDESDGPRINVTRSPMSFTPGTRG